MKVVGAMTPDGLSLGLPGFKNVDLRSGAVTCGVREMPDNKLDADHPRHEHLALVRVSAFSCNYRDRAIISQGVSHAAANELVPFGSEFCGHVVAVGSRVKNVVPGDRVFGLFTYPDTPQPNMLPGVASNRCSQELLPVEAGKLIKVPPNMTDAEAAAFSLNGLTVASMLRRLALKAKDRLLILAGRSNVALFSCQAAAAQGIEVTMATTTESISHRLLELGAAQVVILRNPAAGLMACEELVNLTSQGFDAIIDPFMDVHLHQAPELLAMGGRYITCGSARQAAGDHVAHNLTPVWMQQHFYPNFLIKNIQLIGNCLGGIKDMKYALALWKQGLLNPVLDRCFPACEAGEFLHRSYVDPERLGKVVCLFP